jgi:steroid 5-alpha reductase family enzyme
MNFVAVSGVSAVVLTVVHAVTFCIGRRLGRYNVVDVAWGVGFGAVAVVAMVLGRGDVLRRCLLLVLVGIWALRLSWHVYRKTAGRGEDPRYADLLRGATVGQVLRKVFVVQALATWFVSLPLQLSAVTGPTPRGLAAVPVAGVLVWTIGVTFETVADSQLSAFKADPAHRGQVMDRGLWAWTRHPNYFGDACVWWGLWLITINNWTALATLPSPLLMTYFLAYATGGRRTEKYMEGRPGFDEYKNRTSFFVPWPPRSARR